MPDVVDLSALRNKQQESKAQDIPAAGDSEAPAKQQVKTALLVIQNAEGNWQATPDLDIAALIEPQDVPDGQALIAGLSVILSDIQAEKTANMTAMFMQQMAQAQMQAMQNAALAQQLHLPKS